MQKIEEVHRYAT